MKNIRESLEISEDGADYYSLEDFDDNWDDKLSEIRQMDRDREKRRELLGYRNGVFTGKDAGFEEGLNIGFKESVLDGYKFGIVRGVCSALAFLPKELREKLTGEGEAREEFQKLHNSVHAISTETAVKLFYETMTIKQEEGSGSGSGLGRYVSELSSLLDKSPKIEVSQHSKYLSTSVESRL